MPLPGFRFARAAVLAAAVLAAAPALSRERPGTPASPAMTLVGPTTLRMTWINTRGVGSDRNGATEQTWFDVEGQTDPSLPEFAANPIRGQLVTFDIPGLPPGRHCFRAWSREAPDGVRSEVPSAWACGDVPGAQGPPVSAPVPAIGAILPDRGARVWVDAPLYYASRARTPGSADEGAFDDTGRTEQDSGVFQVVAASAACRYPWRRVLYQYGGWAGLGPAGFTRRDAAYGLCWFSHLPTPAETVVPPPPVAGGPVGGRVCVRGWNCP